MEAQHEEAFWSVKDVAAHLNVSVGWVYAAAARRVLPRRKFGGLLRFLPSEVRAWAEAQRIQPGGLRPIG